MKFSCFPLLVVFLVDVVTQGLLQSQLISVIEIESTFFFFKDAMKKKGVVIVVMKNFSF